jgi:hypothetical protein
VSKRTNPPILQARSYDLGTLLTIGGFLGLTIGWLVWPILLVAMGTCVLWALCRRIIMLPILLVMGTGAFGLAIITANGGAISVGHLYFRASWELLLAAWGYTTSGQVAPAAEILADHLRSWPVAGVSFAFGPLLGATMALGLPGRPRPDAAGRNPAAPESRSPAQRGAGDSGSADSDSAEDGAGGRWPGVRWYTGADFADLDSAGALQVWGPGVVIGAVTGWIGPPKIGKSEAYTQLIACCVLGILTFLSWPVMPTPVVVLAEETAPVYRDKALTAAGWLSAAAWTGHRFLRPLWRLSRRLRRRAVDAYYRRVVRVQRRDIHVICGREVAGVKSADTLPVYLELARQRAVAVGARLIVVDSLNFWVPEAITNDAAAKVAASHFGHLAAQGFAVILVHHMNKKGQMAGPDSLYSQLDFRVDCTVPGDGDPRTTTIRHLQWSGRFQRDMPTEARQIVYDMVDGRLVLAGVLPAAPAVPAAPGAYQEPDSGGQDDSEGGEPTPTGCTGCTGCASILAVLEDDSALTAAEVGVKVAMGDRAVRVHMANHLVPAGAVEEIAGESKSKPKRYRLR